MTPGTFEPFLATYYFHFIAEYSELRKGRHQLVIPSKDKNIGKEFSAAAMQICNTRNLSKTAKAHELHAFATPLGCFQICICRLCCKRADGCAPELYIVLLARLLSLGRPAT